MLHPVLTDSLDRLEQHFRADPRCLGMYLWGSLGNDTADDWSDVDVAALFRDEDYPAVKAELRSVCDTLCGPTLVWLPEGERPDFGNYAFLFTAQDRLHLYDFTIVSATALQQITWLRPQRILFDTQGLLAAAGRREATVAGFNPGVLDGILDNYWVYAYLNGKYYQRRDVYKMLYVQNVLFQTHVRLLHAFHPGDEWNWWARDIGHLAAAERDELLVYFGARAPGDIGRALEVEFDLFSRDARRACEQWNRTYPAALEAGVRQHLAVMQVIGK